MDQPELDIDLFNRIRRNDRLALNLLFSRYYQQLCTFANQYLRHRSEAEELVSDVFFSLWQKRKQLTVNKNLRGYLYVTVRNAAFAILKQRRPTLESIEDVLCDEHPSESESPVHILMFKELENHFERAVNNLPPRRRQIFLLKWRDNLSYREIGEVLGVAEKTVENQLVKGMLKLKQDLHFYYKPQFHG